MGVQRVLYHFSDDAIYNQTLFIRTEHAEIIVTTLIVLAILFSSPFYNHYRVEMELFSSLSSLTWKTAAVKLFGPHGIFRTWKNYLAVVAIVARIFLWNEGIGSIDRYAPFKHPMLYRFNTPVHPRECFNDTKEEERNFLMYESRKCASYWNDYNGYLAVQFASAIYSASHHEYACLSPTHRIAYGKIRVDEYSLQASEEFYEHDMKQLHHSCVQVAKEECSFVESVQTTNNGTTRMTIRNGTDVMNVRLDWVRENPGIASLREMALAVGRGDQVLDVLRIGMAVELSLKFANCFRSDVEVPIGDKQKHLFLNWRALLFFVLVEVVMALTASNNAAHGRRLVDLVSNLFG